MDFRSRIERVIRGRPGAGPRARLLVEAAVVLITVVVLERVVFARHFAGETSPKWDFFNHYTTEAHAWWRDGSFFRPVDWLSYLWGGYPGVANLQNSSWYLPVGAVEALVGYTPYSAAVLSALTVGFGAVGAHLLLRAWGLRPSAAMVGLILWFFAAGFYANASHLDIMRAYAWAPWVMLCASPTWPWRRWWAPVVAVLVFWQAILGAYPGTLLAAVYIGAVWVVGVLVLTRPRPASYLLPLGAAVAGAGALAALRFLPFYLARGSSTPETGDTSEITRDLLGTFLFAYDDLSLPNDVTMRSFFLPATALAACAFVRWRDPLARLAALTGAAAIVLGVPDTPWEGLVDRLPGLDVSRFRMSDFKVFFLLALCVLAATAVNDVITRRQAMSQAGVPVRERSPSRWVGPSAYLLALLAALVWIGDSGPFDDRDWMTQVGLVVLAAALLLLAHSALRPFQLRSVIALVALVTGLSGFAWAFTTGVTWMNPRVDYEILLFGTEVDELVASRAPDGPHERRPAREMTTEDTAPGAIVDTFTSVRGGASFYDGRIGLTGYVNLKGTPTYEAIARSLGDPSTSAAALGFWTAPGMVIRTEAGSLPTADQTAACLADQVCGLGSVEAVAYEDAGRPVLVYRVESADSGEISFNEAYYAGWEVEACATGDSARCLELAPRSGSSGQLVADGLPPGEWTVTAAYHLPGKRAAWALFAAGAAAVAVWSLALLLVARRGKEAA